MSVLKRMVAVLLCVLVAIVTDLTVSWIAYDFGAEPKYIVAAGVFFAAVALLLSASAYFTWGSND